MQNGVQAKKTPGNIDCAYSMLCLMVSLYSSLNGLAMMPYHQCELSHHLLLAIMFILAKMPPTMLLMMAMMLGLIN